MCRDAFTEADIVTAGSCNPMPEGQKVRQCPPPVLGERSSQVNISNLRFLTASNVSARINVKLGGINSIVDPIGSHLADPAHPTIIMGESLMS